MEESEVPEFVAHMAKSIALKVGDRNRPASIRAITVQAIGPADVILWVVTHQAGNPQGHGPSYRFSLRRIEQPGRAILSTEQLARVSGEGIEFCTYWDIPGNVRDIGLTAGRRALHLDWNA